MVDRRKDLIKFGILKKRLLVAFAAVNTRISFTDIITSLINFFWIFVIFCKCTNTNCKSFSSNSEQSSGKICN